MRTRRTATGRTEQGAAYLPRPALGRRPWFAFLRRARRRRRFALAMGRERTRAAVPRQPMTVRLTCGEWQSPPLLILTTRAERFRGLAPYPGPFGVLMRTRSVHGFGLRTTLRFVAFDSAGVVRRAGVLRPCRAAFCGAATWMAEFPHDFGEPPPGAEALLDRLGQWPEL